MERIFPLRIIVCLNYEKRKSEMTGKTQRETKQKHEKIGANTELN